MLRGNFSFSDFEWSKVPASELEGRVDRLVQGTIVGLSAPIGPAAGRARVAGPARAGSVGTASHLSRLVIADGGRTLVVRATDVDYVATLNLVLARLDPPNAS